MKIVLGLIIFLILCFGCIRQSIPKTLENTSQTFQNPPDSLQNSSISLQDIPKIVSEKWNAIKHDNLTSFKSCKNGSGIIYVIDNHAAVDGPLYYYDSLGNFLGTRSWGLFYRAGENASSDFPEPSSCNLLG